MRPQSLGRRDRLFNRAAWHLAVSKRERPALGRLLLIACAVMTVVLWGRQNWIPAFPSDATTPTTL
jgi:hypothetical protein